MTINEYSRTKRFLRVAVGQIETRPGDMKGNLVRHIRFIENAQKQGVDMLVFPELSLTGYHVGERALELAMTRDDPFLLELAGLAGDMTVVVGFIEEGIAAQFHNSSAVLRRGQVPFVHRKLNLATYGNLEEDKYFAEGRYVDIYTHETPWNAAILICADMWNPGLVHLAALYGATVLIAPIASSNGAVSSDFSNPDGWKLAQSFYGMMYGLPVIVANLCGQEHEGVNYWGGSRIVDAHGKTLAEGDDRECLVVANLDYNMIRKVRFQLPTVRDSNLDLIHREIERLANRIGVPRGFRSK